MVKTKCQILSETELPSVIQKPKFEREEINRERDTGNKGKIWQKGGGERES